MPYIIFLSDINQISILMGSRVSKPEIKAPHFFFKEVATRNEFNKELIVVFKKLMRQDDFDDWERGYRQGNQMNKQSLLLPQSYDKERIKKYFACCECPADFQMSLVYQRFDTMYKQQLVRRQSGVNKRWYKQQELFLILYELASAVKQFQVRGLAFGDIRPAQMVITSSTQRIKMINIYSFPEQISAIDKCLNKYDKTTKFYFSPEEIKYINSPNQRQNYPNPKTQAFSLGLSILQAAILQDSEELYSLNPRSIDIQMLQSRINTLKQKFPLLGKYISLILAIRPQQRFSCGQLWAILRTYSQKITLMQKFNSSADKQRTNLESFRKNKK